MPEDKRQRMIADSVGIHPSCVRQLNVVRFDGSLIELVIANGTNLHKLQGLASSRKSFFQKPDATSTCPSPMRAAGIFRRKCLKMLSSPVPRAANRSAS